MISHIMLNPRFNIISEVIDKFKQWNVQKTKRKLESLISFLQNKAILTY